MDFYEMSYLSIFQKSVMKIHVLLKSGTLHEDLCTFMITSRSFLLRIKTVSDKSCRGNPNTHFMFNNLFPKIVPVMRKCRKTR